MKHIYFLLFSLFCAASVSAQCDELFISEYVESGFNNRALEIYNPTSAEIDLSGYMIGRYSNGGTTTFYSIQLPAVMIQPLTTFVAVIDKREADGTCREEPLLDGFVVLDTLFDLETGEVVMNDEGMVILTIQFEDVLCSDGTTGLGVVAGETYYEEYDLRVKADGFFAPDYDENRSMYWNGNDAVCLVKGTSVNFGYTNVIDVVGVIGEDPEGGGWVDDLGRDMTQDNTLVRVASIQEGSVQTASGNDDFSGDFNYQDWSWRPKYSFDDLGVHDCECDPNFMGISSVKNFSKIQIAPNPSNGSVVQITAEEGITEIQVFGLDGKLVINQVVENIHTIQSINVNELNEGIYLVKTVLQSGKQGVRKLVVR